MKFNKDQQTFIESRGKNVLVSASAGSGKTTTMISKLLTLLLDDGVDILKLLVLTFTDAAATEMKSKLNAKLLQHAQMLSADPETNGNQIARIYDILERLPFADIGTFHAVFKKILTKYFYLLDIDPSFSLLTQEQEIVLGQSIDRVLDKYTKNQDEEFFVLREIFSKNRSAAAFKERLISLYYQSQEIVNFDNWYTENVNIAYEENLSKNPSVNFLLKHYKATLLSFETKINNVISQAQILQHEKGVAFFEQHKTIMSQLHAWGTPEQMLPFLYNCKIEGSIPQVREERLLEFQEGAKLLNDEFKKQLRVIADELQTPHVSVHIEKMQKTKSLLNKLHEVLNSIIALYTKQKQKKSQLDFQDLQKLTYELLTTHGEVAHELQGQYEFIVVDEFQDVNEIQYGVLKTFARENNLIFIGDLKQSIYEFRLASPKIFLQEMKNFGSNKKNNDLILFNENFRSSNHILQFVNYLFNSLMTENTVGLNYAKTSQLVCGKKEFLHYDEALRLTGQHNVKVLLLNQPSSTKKLQPQEDEPVAEEEEESLTTKEKLSQLVVSAVVDALGKEFYNPKTDSIDTVEYKDIAILTHDSDDFVKELTKTFETYKIPYFSTNKNNLFKTHVGAVLFSVLKVLNNDQNDYALTSVLLSPVGQFNHNELATIRLTDNTRNLPFYECLQNFLRADTTDANLIKIKNKLKAFFEKINNYRQLLVYKTVYQTMQIIISENNLQQHYSSLPGGEVASKTVEEFLQLLVSETFNYNLTLCLHYLNELSEKDNFKINIASGENAVNVLTMHRSKGLEWPVVILAHLGKKFNNLEKTKDFVVSQDFGIGMKFKNIYEHYEFKTLPYLASVKEKNTRELKEHIRLLYVATTRAKNYLYLVGHQDVEKLPKLSSQILFSRSYLELLLHAMTPVERQKLINLKNAQTKPDQVPQMKLNAGTWGEGLLSLYNDFAASDESLVGFEVEKLPKVSHEVVGALSQNFNFEYQQLPNIAQKNSVTAILQEEDYAHYFEKNHQVGLENLPDRKNELKLGTAYHTVMQSLNFNETLANVQEIIEKFVSVGKIEAEVAQWVNPEFVCAAIAAIKPLLLGSVKVLKEQPFYLFDNYSKLVAKADTDQKIIVQGVIDLIILHKNRAIVVDFKTNKTNNINYLKQSYALQLNLYAQSVGRAFGVQNVEKFIYSFENDALIEM